jgi:excisionase family DNA binding protein
MEVTSVAADTTPAGRSHAVRTAGTLAGQSVMHTAEEAARLLKVKRSWLERQAAARKIPFSMLGGSYRFSDLHLAEIVQMNEVKPAPVTPDVPTPTRSHRKTRARAALSATSAPLRPRPRDGPRRA